MANSAAIPSNNVKLTQEYKNEVNGALYNYISDMIYLPAGATPDQSGAVAAQIDYMTDYMNTTGPWTGAGGAGAPLYSKGWAAAGIWYNSIAELNGNLTVAVNSFPVVTQYPEVMETILAKKVETDEELVYQERFKPDIKGQNDPSNYLASGYSKEFADMLYDAYVAWDTASGVNSNSKVTGNVITDGIAMLLGTNGLYSMRRNAGVHPLAQLTGIGRSLVEAAIRNLGYAAIGGAGGILLGDILGKFAGNLGTTAASLLVSLATMQLTVGFVLFYVVPFLPFLYCFFAVGGWVKGIFEAMVGAPLWALAHIRIDGHGLPGQAAMSGYFLIFEIFIRPILIVFGLLASISIFAALVRVLNSVFTLVTENITGYDVDSTLSGAGMMTQARGRIDQFFFTVIYAIIVYMMGMSSFKLIDQIPNQILRWMGQSVATFGDQREDPAQGLMGRVSMGSQQAIGRMGGGLNQLIGVGKKISS